MEIVQEKTGNIPERNVTLDMIAGMEVSKRALEVALAGTHPIVFLYNSSSCAADLVKAGRRIAANHGLVFHALAYPVCPCGNYGNKTKECRCRPASISRHLAKLGKRKHEFDLWMDACQVRPVSVSEPNGESETVMAERVMAARRNAEVIGKPDQASQELLEAWQKHIGQACNLECILRTARTIARLEGSGKKLHAYHIAEAIQYQAQSLSWLWDFIKPQAIELKTQGNEGRR